METPNLDQQVRFPQQEMAARSLQEVLRCPNPPPSPPQHQQQETRPRPPQPEPGQRCPRCDSTNTKFCYYNNYSLTQPRYFCKSCRRYWTKGGTLRNVPIGGGSRKNKRPAPSSSSKRALERAITPPPPPPHAYDPTPLTLSFAGLQDPPPDAFFLGNPSHGTVIPGTAIPGSTVFAAVPPRAPGFLDILRTGTLDNTTTGAFNNNQPYGFCEHWNVEEVRTGEGSGSANQVMQPFDELGGAAAAPRQEAARRGGVDGDNRLFRGLQCQAGGDATTMTDQGRDYLSGGGSTWQGLVNSFLI